MEYFAEIRLGEAPYFRRIPEQPLILLVSRHSGQQILVPAAVRLD